MLGLLVAAGLAPLTSQGCIDLRAHDRDLLITGRLEVRVYPGPPNYRDVRAGDVSERVYVLALPRPICIDDGGDFSEPGERFSRVHVFASSASLRSRLRAGVGSRVQLRGSAFASHTAHHRAPLVLAVREIRIERR